MKYICVQDAKGSSGSICLPCSVSCQWHSTCGQPQVISTLKFILPAPKSTASLLTQPDTCKGCKC